MKPSRSTLLKVVRLIAALEKPEEMKMVMRSSGALYPRHTRTITNYCDAIDMARAALEISNDDDADQESL